LELEPRFEAERAGGTTWRTAIGPRTAFRGGTGKSFEPETPFACRIREILGRSVFESMNSCRRRSVSIANGVSVLNE